MYVFEVRGSEQKKTFFIVFTFFFMGYASYNIYFTFSTLNAGNFFF